MAVTWTIAITVTKLGTKDIAVTATREDDAIPETRTLGPVTGKYDTATMTPQELLNHYRDIFRDLYDDQVARETQVDTLIGQAETALKNALEAQEA